MSSRLNEKVALITGGGAGIGAAIAKTFVDEGAKVVITGRRREKIEAFAATLPAGTCAVCEGDIRNAKDAETMVETAVSAFGKLNILINNAGIDPAGTVTDIPIDQWLATIDTNLNGAFYMTRFSVPKLIEQGGGSIINVSSISGVRAIPGMSAYSASKSALIGFTNAVALDYGSYGIRVNIISPGTTATDMLKNKMQGLADSQGIDIYETFGLVTRFNPIKRACEPSEIAPLAVFLASDESKFITGQNILIDGGATVVSPNGAAISLFGKAWGE
jgi:meso-butanediol dehydrogenase/(S,S)-butanediol dehydrogenase/diacetyl reductase